MELKHVLPLCTNEGLATVIPRTLQTLQVLIGIPIIISTVGYTSQHSLPLWLQWRDLISNR